MSALWLKSGYTVKFILSFWDFLCAQAIFHRISLLSSQYRYSTVLQWCTIPGHPLPPPALLWNYKTLSSLLGLTTNMTALHNSALNSTVLKRAKCDKNKIIKVKKKTLFVFTVKYHTDLWYTLIHYTILQLLHNTSLTALNHIVLFCSQLQNNILPCRLLGKKHINCLDLVWPSSNFI